MLRLSTQITAARRPIRALRPYDRLRILANRGASLDDIARTMGIDGNRAGAKRWLRQYGLYETWQYNHVPVVVRKNYVRPNRKKLLGKDREFILLNAREEGRLNVLMARSLGNCRINGLPVTFHRLKRSKSRILIRPRRIHVVMFPDGTWQIVLPGAKNKPYVLKVASTNKIDPWPTKAELNRCAFRWGMLRSGGIPKRVTPRTVAKVRDAPWQIALKAGKLPLPIRIREL